MKNQLARESTLFTDVISQCGTTPQSLSSLMTGLFPYTDGILRKNGPFLILRRSNTSLAAQLSAQGYRTHAITSSIQSATVTGVDLDWLNRHAGNRRQRNANTAIEAARTIAVGRPNGIDLGRRCLRHQCGVRSRMRFLQA